MKTNKITKLGFNLWLCLGFVFCALSVNAQVIYDNGVLATGATSESGVAAPAGTQWSEVARNAFDATSANTTAGAGCQLIGATTNNRCADDFVVPVGQTWTISSVQVFGYQTGFAGTTSPFVGANIRIWRGFPEGASSTLVFGDTTTNRLGSSTNSNLFRVFNTVSPSPGTAPGTTRIIWQNNITVSPSAVLTAGQYWIDFQMDAGATGNFTPTTTIRGTRATSIMNAQQKITAGTWAALIDTGNPAAAQDLPQDFPFKLTGTIAGAGVPRSRVGDFNGDNKTDFAVARAGGLTGFTDWLINDGTTFTSTTWGLGVGFAGGDQAVPADFDGDGKTDIAVWRAGAPTQAAFFILQSSNSTVRTERFGQTGDIPTVVADYDGDGKADPAVYRDSAFGSQSYYFYRGSLNNSGGIVTYVPWGRTGDKPVPGDYDGDGKFDPTVVRNEGGSAVFYHLLSTVGYVRNSFGLATDKFVPGDYDGDNKTDIAVARANGGYEWYVLKSTDGGILTSIWSNNWGVAASDILVPGDYDGDNRTDFAVWRTSATDNGVFYVAPTKSAIIGQKWGSTSGSLTAPDSPVNSFRVY